MSTVVVRCAYHACRKVTYRQAYKRKYCNTRCKDTQRIYEEKCRAAGVVPSA